MTETIIVKNYKSEMQTISPQWTDKRLEHSEAFATLMNKSPQRRTLKFVISGPLEKLGRLKTEILVDAYTRDGSIDRPKKVEVINLSTTDEESKPLTSNQKKAVIGLTFEVLSDIGTEAFCVTRFLGLEIDWRGNQD